MAGRLDKFDFEITFEADDNAEEKRVFVLPTYDFNGTLFDTLHIAETVEGDVSRFFRKDGRMIVSQLLALPLNEPVSVRKFRNDRGVVKTIWIKRIPLQKRRRQW